MEQKFTADVDEVECIWDGFIYAKPIITPLVPPKFFATEREELQYRYDNIIMGISETRVYPPNTKIQRLVDGRIRTTIASNQCIDKLEIWICPNSYTRAKKEHKIMEIFFAPDVTITNDIINLYIKNALRGNKI